MTGNECPGRVVEHASLEEYFQGAVNVALEELKVEARQGTVHYLVNLMTGFTRSEQLYERDDDGVFIRPLALLYAEALEHPSREARQCALRRLGDVALFISGVFSRSLTRKPVDVNYYMSMGGSAYGCLSSSVAATPGGADHSKVFDELATKFVEFADVLGEVGDRTSPDDAREVLRLYEQWVRTGSARAAKQLRRAGIEPHPSAVSKRRH